MLAIGKYDVRVKARAKVRVKARVKIPMYVQRKRFT